ncbi:43907_t:CDS:2 [Gigaspora margarita]|uniref:43907_t:CDS:1 n=1 Tax=Gigaspora margarita TaxID=4874 RepID=A0ABN7UXJ3_GIGMA|nr:43907_t:CDS:2 [Gigaspora margarita]
MDKSVDFFFLTRSQQLVKTNQQVTAPAHGSSKNTPRIGDTTNDINDATYQHTATSSNEKRNTTN